LRNNIVAVTILAIALTAVMAVFLPKNQAYTVSSRFEGKTVRMIDFIGVRKGSGGKEEIVPIRSFNGLDVLAEHNSTTLSIGKGDAPKYKIVTIDEPLDPAKISDSIKVLFSTGKVVDVRAEVEEYGDGVIVRFYCSERPLVSRIDFKGIDLVQEADLKEKVLLRAGDPFRPDLMEKSLPMIKKKYAESGYFSAVLDYKAEPDPDKDDGSIVVTVIVDEGEQVNVVKVSLLGAKKIPDTELKALIVTKEKRFLDDGKFKREDFEMDKMKIIAYYKQNGYLDAEIIDDPNQISYEWDNPEDSGNSVRAIYINLKIYEGERYYFDGYEINGVTGTVGSKKSGQFITREKIESNLELRKIDPDDTAEHISQFLTSPASDFDDDVIFNNTLFEKDRQGIAFQYASQGRIYTRVSPKEHDRYAEKLVNGKIERRKYRKYAINIVEGPETFLEKIYIRGNKKTKEKVIRREVVMKEESNGVCELFDSSKMEVSRSRIYNLGFFKQVNIDIRPGTREDRVNVIIEVEEQSTGTISLGGSWGSNGGFAVFGSVGETNLNGNGQNVTVKVNYGAEAVSGSINFTEPWFMDKPVALNTSIFFTQTEYTDTSLFLNSDEDASYISQTIGYSVGPTYRFLYYCHVGMDWTHSFKSIPEASGDCSDDIFMQKRQGYKEKRAISIFTGYNSVNNSLNPSDGMSVKFSTTFVGGALVRGEEHYIQFDPSFDLYYSPFHLPLLKDYPCVFELRGAGSFIRPPFQKSSIEKRQHRAENEWIETDDRFQVGGPQSLRGWDYYTDSALPQSWRKGLYHQILYGAEFRVPIQKDYLWSVLFFDAASLWTDKFWEKQLSDTDRAIFERDRNEGNLRDIRDFRNGDLMSYFRYSYGFGFKIQIPMMPLRFWFGKKLEWAGKEHGYFKSLSGFNFQFGIGDMAF